MSDNRGSNINAFLLGMIVGGVLGVLFAPGKGEETRRKLKENWREWSKKMLEVAEGFGEEFPEKLKEIEPHIEPVTETVQPLRQLADEIKPVIGNLTEEAEGWVQPVIESAQEIAGEKFPEVGNTLGQVVDQAQAGFKKQGRRIAPRFFKGI